MRDAYAVLGIQPGADDETLKKAYRQKCKQYHPDLHPNDASAEEHFKEVQAAYSEIMRQKNGGAPTGGGYQRSGASRQSYGTAGGGQQYSDPFGFGNGFGGFGFGPFGFGFGFGDSENDSSNGYYGQTSGGYYGSRSSGQAQDDRELQAANNYIRNGYYQEALTVLEGIPEAKRTARWHYYCALANYGLGNNIRAQSEARAAVDAEPGNYEYQNLLDRMQYSSNAYTSRQTGYAQPRGYNNLCQCCITAWMMQMLCSFLNFCCCGGRGFY